MGAYLAKNTAKRSKKQNEVSNMCKEYMENYDISGSGTLSRDEVKRMANDLLTRFTPLVGGLTEEDVDLIMRCGGTNVRDEVTSQQLPEALSVLMAVRDMNKDFHEMFIKFDKDNSGSLPADQLTALLTASNGDVPVMQSDVDYVLKQLEPRGATDPIREDQIKAAMACWYSLHPPPTTQVKAIFQAWDKAGNGVISKKEFVEAMIKLKPDFKQNQLELLFNQADKSRTGFLDYQEFVDFIWMSGVDTKDTPSNISRPAPKSPRGGFSSGLMVHKNKGGGSKSPRNSPRSKGENEGTFSTGGNLTTNARS